MYKSSKYVLFLSYGKDSLATLELIYRHNLKLDEIIHVDVYADDETPAELPEMIEFKSKADKYIKEHYGWSVIHLKSNVTYDAQFYTKRVRGRHVGSIYGFPLTCFPWCNDRLKMRPVKAYKSALKKQNIKLFTYLGIASNEVARAEKFSDKGLYGLPLIDYGWSEQMCYEWCRNKGLLSPQYSSSFRGGCWFCHNQKGAKLLALKENYPEYFQKLLEWEKNSPTGFKPDGRTITEIIDRYREDSRQMSFDF